MLAAHHGARSTPSANARWPDTLARRLADERRGPRVAVLNAGISGNRVLGDGAGLSALARFDKDVLLQTGVTHVVVHADGFRGAFGNDRFESLSRNPALLRLAEAGDIVVYKLR